MSSVGFKTNPVRNLAAIAEGCDVRQLASYFQNFQNPDGGVLQPQEGFVFWTGSTKTGAAGKVVSGPNLLIPTGFYLMLMSGAFSSDAAADADFPLVALVMGVPGMTSVQGHASVASQFMVLDGPGIILNGSMTSPGNPDTSVLGLTGIGPVFVPGNFPLIVASISATGVPVNAIYSVAGLLLADSQNPQRREVY